MTSQNEQADDAALPPSTSSIPIDLSHYQTSSSPDPLHSYYSDDEPEVELYLDGAGGVTTDPARAVLPSSVKLPPAEPRAVDRAPYQPNPDSPYSEVGGFYRSLASPHQKAATPPRRDNPTTGSAAGSARPRASAGSAQALPPTNVLAVMSLVFALMGGTVVAIALGHVALSQIVRTGERGAGMANAALIIAYLSLATLVVIVIVILASLPRG